MKILLTGASGFLGLRLLAVLRAAGHEVVAATRASTDTRRLHAVAPGIETCAIDADDAAAAFERHPGIVAVVHAATDYGRDPAQPTATFWPNVALPMRLLEGAMAHGVPLFANMDTFFNSGAGNYAHLGAYTLSKRHFQEWGRHVGEAGRMVFANLRLYHLYGAGDGPDKFVPAIVRRCLAGEDIALTEGTQERDFIHVDDAAQAVAAVLAAEAGRGAGYRHYDVGTGEAVAVRRFVETVNRLCGDAAHLRFGALPTREGEFRRACADPAALAALGWRPRVGLEAGIGSVIDAMRAARGARSQVQGE